MTTTLSNEIILADNKRFYYSIRPYEMENSLGKVIATLAEYIFTSSDGSDVTSYKLYKTKEGNWYEIESESINSYAVIRELKSAIDSIKTTL